MQLHKKSIKKKTETILQIKWFFPYDWVKDKKLPLVLFVFVFQKHFFFQVFATMFKVLNYIITLFIL
jgi:hypothetical protein